MQFSYELAVSFLKRSPREVLHHVENDVVTKAMRIGKDDLIYSIHSEAGGLVIEFLLGNPTSVQQTKVVQFVREWFDVDTDLKPYLVLIV